MNLRNLTDDQLLLQTDIAVREEKMALTKVLFHLREVQQRRLFSNLKYENLFKYVTGHLRYSEDQAYQRIAAMRMLTDVPEIENKLNSGEISLSHVGLAHSLFLQEKKLQNRELPAAEKLQVINAISNTSVRQAQKITLSLSSQPETLRADRTSPVSDTQSEIRFTVSNEVLQKLETLKGRFAHKYPQMNLGELINEVCDIALEKTDPTRTSRKPRVTSHAHIRRQVFQAAGNQCSNCKSTHALEIDHIYPKAWGGTDDATNLRVLCRNCNQRAAIKNLGRQKMQKHLPH